MIRAIAIDDEPPALRILSSFCEAHSSISLEKTFTQPEEGLKHLARFPVDVIFLDIDMPDMSGLEFITKMSQQPIVILCSAHREYALEGFELDVADYLLKPFSPERFAKAIEKADERMKHRNESKTHEEESILIRADYKLMRVAHREILFLESLDDYVRFHLANNKRIVARTTLKELETRLPNHSFTRVHKSYMASKSAIDSIRNKVIYIGDKSIPIGANYFDQVKMWYGVA